MKPVNLNLLASSILVQVYFFSITISVDQFSSWFLSNGKTLNRVLVGIFSWVVCFFFFLSHSQITSSLFSLYILVKIELPVESSTMTKWETQRELMITWPLYRKAVSYFGDTKNKLINHFSSTFFFLVCTHLCSRKNKHASDRTTK